PCGGLGGEQPPLNRPLQPLAAAALERPVGGFPLRPARPRRRVPAGELVDEAMGRACRLVERLVVLAPVAVEGEDVGARAEGDARLARLVAGARGPERILDRGP